MKFKRTKLAGATIVDIEPHRDARGFFARSWCPREFKAHRLDANLKQCNISYNKKKGTLRGMHYTAASHKEAKLVRCTAGAIYDVIIDLRPKSRTFKRWISVRLTAENRRMLYVPAGFAHGFQTLEPDTEVFYQMSEFYKPGTGRGVRWNDPAFKIRWPLAVTSISTQDRQYPDFLLS